MNIFYFASIQLGRANAANRHTLEVCNHLAERGHQLRLFVPFKRSPATEIHPNVCIMPVPVFYGGPVLLITLSFYLTLPWWSWPHFKRMRPAVVYMRSTFLDWLAIAPLRPFFKFTCVAEVNGIRSMETARNTLRRRLIAWQERLSLRLCDKAVGVTPELRQWAIERGRLKPEHTTTIGNGVPVDLFRPVPATEAQRHLGLNPDVHYLSFVGSLTPWHDTPTMIRAMPDILAKFPQRVRLLIVGDGPEKERLVELGRQLGIDHALEWAGQVPADRVPLYINASEICLAPYLPVQDYFSPIKIFEYMGCGRPFITTRLGVALDDELESCRCGVLVPPGDPSALAQAVLRLLRDPEEREQLGHRGRQLAVEQHSWARVAERIEQFIA